MINLYLLGFIKLRKVLKSSFNISITDINMKIISDKYFHLMNTPSIISSLIYLSILYYSDFHVFPTLPQFPAKRQSTASIKRKNTYK